jgi:hypothetical protein
MREAFHMPIAFGRSFGTHLIEAIRKVIDDAVKLHASTA